MVRKPVTLMVRLTQAALALALSAAAVRGDSPFAAGTLGEPVAATDARAAAMGGVAIGALDGVNAAAVNPAVAAAVPGAVFNLDVYRCYNTYRTDYGDSTVVNYDVRGVRLAMPVITGAALTLAFQEFFNYNYDLSRPLQDGGETLGVSRLAGRGGIYQGRLGWSQRIGEKWYLGGAGAYDFGAPKEIYRKEFKVKGYSNIEETLEADYRGIGVIIGAGWAATPRVTVGVVGEYYLPHRAHKEFFTEYATLAEDDFKMTPPWSAGAGVAYAWGPRARVAADVRYRAWDGFKLTGVEGGTTDFSFHNTLSLHAGGEGRFTTSRRAFLPLRLPYRAGVFYEPWYDGSRGGGARWGAAAGFGYLFQNNEDSRLDVTMEYARRGNISANGIQEEYYNLYLSVVGLESWLRRPEEEED